MLLFLPLNQFDIYLLVTDWSYFYENQSYNKVASSRLPQFVDQSTYCNSPETIHVFRESHEQELCIAMM